MSRLIGPPFLQAPRLHENSKSRKIRTEALFWVPEILPLFTLSRAWLEASKHGTERFCEVKIASRSRPPVNA